MLAGLSSTIRTFAISDGRVSASHGPADFDSQNDPPSKSAFSTIAETNPLSMSRSSGVIRFDVTTRIRNAGRCWIFVRGRTTSNPLTSGIIRSRTIKSGSSRLAALYRLRPPPDRRTELARSAMRTATSSTAFGSSSTRTP